MNKRFSILVSIKEYKLYQNWNPSTNKNPIDGPHFQHLLDDTHEVHESNGDMNQRGKTKEREEAIEKGIEKGKMETRTLQMQNRLV